jgi:UPF0755 protein
VNAYLKFLTAGLLTCAVIGLAVAVVLSSYNSRVLPVSEDSVIELKTGQSFSNFAEQLAQAGLIEHVALWSWQARFSGDARRIQAGEYWLRVGDTPRMLLDRLLSGEVVYYQVKLLEGWTVSQVLDELASHTTLVQELIGADIKTVLGALGLPEGNAEGLFFPDTYRYERGASDADILRRAAAKLNQELERVWLARDTGLPFETPYDALIIASLIEKETGRDEDRSKISQVFSSRLRVGMRLQTDPSVIYGLGSTFDGNLTRRHLRQDTPYNTYTRRGLPPTPIALTGLRSLEAALHPASGDFLYFVSRGDGSSQFSVSLEEHQDAVRKYQLK